LAADAGVIKKGRCSGPAGKGGSFEERRKPGRRESLPPEGEVAAKAADAGVIIKKRHSPLDGKNASSVY